VARIYAGILGPLALAASLADGVLHRRHPDSVLFAAWVSLLVFSAVGYVAGWIAGRIVQESVGAVISAELAEHASIGQPEATPIASQPETG
jgi:hypothetical protein